MIMLRKSNENSDNDVKIEEFYCTIHKEGREKRAVHIWEEIVEKFAKRRSESWKKVA